MVYNSTRSSRPKLLDLSEIINIQLELFDKTHRSIIAKKSNVIDLTDDDISKQIPTETVIGGAVFRKIPTAASFLAKFIRKYEKKLNPKNENTQHLFNFHTRIYHQILQNIDNKQLISIPTWKETNYDPTQDNNKTNNDNNTNNYLHHYANNICPKSSSPRSITMTIEQLSTMIPQIKNDVLNYFHYNADLLYPLIENFFKILHEAIKQCMTKIRDRKQSQKDQNTPGASDTSKHPNKRRVSIYNTNTYQNIKSVCNQRVDFGPYKRKSSFRYFIIIIHKINKKNR